MNRSSTATTTMHHHERLEATTDLCTLSPLSDDTVLACLRERFMTDALYTKISSSALIAFNPHKHIATNADEQLQKYSSAYRDTSSDKAELTPHIFQLANNAYYHMRRTSQDQSIIFSGETGSGKSENRRLAISSLLDLSLSQPGKKGSKLGSQIPSAEFVLESFGNARTLFNPNASRFGKYTELQFNDRGRLCGVKSLDYYLENNRVSKTPSGERNFHVFYYLTAGASDDERAHLHLPHKATYRYLGQANSSNRAHSQHEGTGSVDSDSTRFNNLKASLKTTGISNQNISQIFQLLSTILLLGNLDFVIDPSRNEDAAVVRLPDSLLPVADFLGVQISDLENALSYRTQLLGNELCTIFLDPDGASDNRDDLAKMLYSLLFAWLNERINQRLCKDDTSFHTFIGLLDFPGPQNASSQTNTFDQFCVNFTNERLHRWSQHRLFDSHSAEYQAEEIAHLTTIGVPYFDNTECVRLLQNVPGGIVHIMDDQAQRMPKKTNQTMVEAVQKRWAKHSSFKAGMLDRSGNPTFTISHYHGPVTYSAEGFLERNLDSLNPDFVSLLFGNATNVGAAGYGRKQGGAVGGGGSGVGKGSANPFIRGLFASRVVKTQTHPKNEDTIVAAQQSIRPLRTPSTRRKKSARALRATEDTIVEEEIDASAPEKTPAKCIAGELRAALDTLFETLEETQSWHVFCINPNDSQLPNQLEGRSVKGQIRSAGLTEVAKRNAVTFEVGMKPVEFCERYREVMDDHNVHEGDEREQIGQVKSTFDFADLDLVIGKHRVFLSHSAFHRLEDLIRAKEEEERRNHRAPNLNTDLSIDPKYGPIGIDLYALPENSLPTTPAATTSAPRRRVKGVPDFRRSNSGLPLMTSPGLVDDLPDGGEDEADDLGYDDDRPHRGGGGGGGAFSDTHSRTSGFPNPSTSNWGSESHAPSRARESILERKPILPEEPVQGETTEIFKESAGRRRWVKLCSIMTYWVPTSFLTLFGRMKREDVRQAWREKLAINMLIWLMCGLVVFVLVFLERLICPTQHVFNPSELASHSSILNPGSILTSIRGEVFDLNILAKTHLRVVNIVPIQPILKYGGASADAIFPVQVSALCNGVTGTVSPYVTLSSKNVTDPNAQYHDFRTFTGDIRPDWYFENMVQMRFNARVGFLGYTPKVIRSMANTGSSVAIYHGMVYDLSDYIKFPPVLKAPEGQAPPQADTQFMDSRVVDLFQLKAGSDVTHQLNHLGMDSALLNRQKVCLRNLFLIGKVDNRNSSQCLFSTYILLAFSALMVSVIGVKFLASLNYTGRRAPEDHDKFVICQVPCYTEGDNSLRRTIDSIAQTKYDDKRKLLLIVCDGMIVGSGNDRPTPRIVLDILGADPSLDPEPLSFQSLGEGAKQHNMGKVYSGLYESGGHVVPYLVLVKVGKPSERSRPGNRGKRDSQMLLMHFLNKVHFNSPMNPLELEMYHQIKNVIGVNPTFYEFLFMVDADTTVEPTSVNRLISAMIRDRKLLGVCGETELANAKKSIITMMQVYEYFISHHMAKAFESLFGSVTCLPGCFTMYRLRTHDTHKPLLVSNQIIEGYSENRVDTLHMKNLLHLGEDRYLTTLLLKHFPMFKTQFVRDAHAYTVAPEDWRVFLSQRRRWINSTVHNLGELLFLDQLCGFCCFSMRFVVMIDLVSTLTQPVTVAYIAYLIFLVASGRQGIPPASLGLLAAIYGLQALVFLLRRKWDMIGWMMFYIIAIPAFSMFLPLYSFWRMDDFSWGATRLVMGESGKKIIIHDEGVFDPRVIPLKSWMEYENELWDKESNHSAGSYTPQPRGDRKIDAQSSHTTSVYGRETAYEPLPPRVSSLFARASQAYSPLTPPTQSQLRSRSRAASPSAKPLTESGYFDIPVSHSPLQREYQEGVAYAPTDQELERSVMEILASADLNTVTKKGVRKSLEEKFGIELIQRRDVINAAIDRVLLDLS